MGIEPTTTSLPRRCSTTEPPRQLKTQIAKKAGDGNRTRMASLEGWSTTTVLLPHLYFHMGADGFEPPKGKARQIYSLMH